MARLSVYRQLRRYREIAVVLARHGLGALTDHLGWTGRRPRGDGPASQPDLDGDPRTLAGRIRRALEELGPTFIKFGQIMSTRADLVPPELLRELQKLQDRVPAAPFDQIEAQIGRELGRSPAEAFAWIDTQPLAAASIGQVHAARTPAGEDVVVKVQRPNVRRTIEADLDILQGLADLADRHSPWARIYAFHEVAAEIARALRQELDYVREGVNADRLRQQTGGNPHVHVPRVVWSHTTSRVLTLERLRGEKLSEAGHLLSAADRRHVARHLITGILEQILFHGFFHADPHPGNVVLLPDRRIGLLDFGIMGRLDEPTRERLIELVIHLLRGDAARLAGTVEALVDVPPHTDVRTLRRDLEDLRERYYQRPFRQIELSEVIQTLFASLRQHRLRVPADLTLVGKTLITLEGVALHLDPDLSVIELAEPLGRRLIRAYTSPAAVSRRALDRLETYGAPLLELPALLRDLLSEAGAGRAFFRLELAGQKDLQRSLSRFVNRLTFSVLLLALSILVGATLVAGALAGDAAPRWGILVLEIGVGSLAIAVGALLWAIFRSGRI